MRALLFLPFLALAGGHVIPAHGDGALGNGDPHRSQGAPSGSTAVVETALLDINTASVEALRALPGMGLVYAQRVLGGRPYSAKNQLVTRGILPENAYARIRDQIVAHRLPKP